MTKRTSKRRDTTLEQVVNLLEGILFNRDGSEDMREIARRLLPSVRRARTREIARTRGKS